MEGRAQGSVGTTGSLSLRSGQAIFSLASLLFMSFRVEFYTFTAFCFLVTTMGLVVPWSSALAVFDLYSICSGCPPRPPGIVAIILIRDLVLSVLALGAVCATVGVIDILVHFIPTYCPPNLCTRYQISAEMAFISWVLTTISALSNLWSVASR